MLSFLILFNFSPYLHCFAQLLDGTISLQVLADLGIGPATMEGQCISLSVHMLQPLSRVSTTSHNTESATFLGSLKVSQEFGTHGPSSSGVNMIGINAINTAPQSALPEIQNALGPPALPTNYSEIMSTPTSTTLPCPPSALPSSQTFTRSVQLLSPPPQPSLTSSPPQLIPASSSSTLPSTAITSNSVAQSAHALLEGRLEKLRRSGK